MVRIGRAFLASLPVAVRSKDLWAYELRNDAGQKILGRQHFSFLLPYLQPTISIERQPPKKMGRLAVRNEDYYPKTAADILQARRENGSRPLATLGRILQNANLALPESVSLSWTELDGLLQLLGRNHLPNFLCMLDVRTYRLFMHELSDEGAEAVFNALPAITLVSLFNRHQRDPSAVAWTYRRLATLLNGKERIQNLPINIQLIIFDRLRGDERSLFLYHLGIDQQASLFPSLGFGRAQAYFDAATYSSYPDNRDFAIVFGRQLPGLQYAFYHSLNTASQQALRKRCGYAPLLSPVRLCLIRMKYTLWNLWRTLISKLFQ